jgi:hypothetical protein
MASRLVAPGCGVARINLGRVARGAEWNRAGAVMIAKLSPPVITRRSHAYKRRDLAQ